MNKENKEMVRDIAQIRPLISSCLTIFMAIGAASLFSSIEIKLSGARLRPFEVFVLFGSVWAFAEQRTKLLRNLGPLLPVFVFFMCSYSIRAVSGLVVGGYASGVIEFIQAIEFTVFALIIGMICAHPVSRGLFMVVFGSATFLIGFIALIIGLEAGELAGLKAFDEPKYTYGVVCLFAAVYYLLAVNYRWFWTIALLICAPLVVLSGERNAWLGIFGSSLVLAFTGGVFIKRRIGRIIISSLFSIVIFFGSFWAVSQTNEYVARQWIRLLEPLDYLSSGVGSLDVLAAESPSNRARLIQMQNMREIVSAHPWSGLGTGQYFPYASSVAFERDLNYITTMHGEYWQLLVENGVFAFAFYCLTWFMLLRACNIVRRNMDSRFQVDIGIALSAAVYGMITNLFVGGGAVNFILLFLPIGLCLGLWRQIRFASIAGMVGGSR